MNAVCGFVAYNILDRFSEFFADRDNGVEILVVAPPLSTGIPGDGIACVLNNSKWNRLDPFEIMRRGDCLS